MNKIRIALLDVCLLVGLFMSGCAALTGRPLSGSQADIDEEDQQAMTKVGQKAKGFLVWSSSRVGHHDLFVMNTDGSNKRALTQGQQVDWFPRFSPDGKGILFCRSKKGWVAERDANRNWKWDLYTIDFDPDAMPNPEAQTATLVAKNACWGTWIGDDLIQFSRQTQVFHKNLTSGEETLIVDSKSEEALGGADLQQPQLSPNGRFLAITLRGSQRETGVFDLEKRTWTATGKGCQINWHPKEDRIYWVNPSGNGGSEVFSVPMKDGKPTEEFSYEQMRFVDIPGRISHEYFPQMTPDAKWMVWGATQRGHDHDIADYEIFIWEVGAPEDQITRLTFHSGNDRWPDLLLTTSP